MSFRPMTGMAAPKDLTKLRYPLLVSPKLDGIRCTIVAGIPLTRSLEPVRSIHISAMLTNLPEFDGEIICDGPEWSTGPDDDVVARSNSGVMSVNKTPSFTFNVFDTACRPRDPFLTRFERAKQEVAKLGPSAPFLRVVPHDYVYAPEQLAELEDYYVEKGYEGVMLRSPGGRYKYGKSTINEGYLLKLKRTVDAEAKIIGYVPLFVNGNALEKNNLGLAKRSKKKEHLIQTSCLGAFECVLQDGTKFMLGNGFTSFQRNDLWHNIDHYVGTYVTFTCQGFTAAGVPRFPRFRRFRDTADMETTW